MSKAKRVPSDPNVLNLCQQHLPLLNWEVIYQGLSPLCIYKGTFPALSDLAVYLCLTQDDKWVVQCQGQGISLSSESTNALLALITIRERLSVLIIALALGLPGIEIVSKYVTRYSQDELAATTRDVFQSMPKNE